MNIIYQVNEKANVDRNYRYRFWTWDLLQDQQLQDVERFNTGINILLVNP